MIARQRQGLVEAVGVQRLRAAQHRRQRLDRRANHVVVRILAGQAHAGSLTVRTQHQRAGIARGEPLLHQLRPQQPRGPQFGRLHEEVHADAEEEAQPRSEVVHVESGAHGRADVLQAVGQRIAQFLNRRGARFQHVVAGNRYGIEARHVAGAEGDDVAHDPHGGVRRIDVGIADHELLENVVLHGARQVLETRPLLFRRHDVHGHDRQDRPVHGHGH